MYRFLLYSPLVDEFANKWNILKIEGLISKKESI